MNCHFCKLELQPDADTCPRCGTFTPYYYAKMGTSPDAPTYVVGPPDNPTLPNTSYGGLQTPPPLYPALPPEQAPRRHNRMRIIGVLSAIILILGTIGLLNAITQSYHNVELAREAHATATAEARQQAIAEATRRALLENPYTHTGTLAFADALTDNGNGHGWDTDVPINCVFKGGAYHAIAPDMRYGVYCIAEATNFKDVAFDVHMRIIKGDCGGLVFRVVSTYNINKLYAFYVCQDGYYFLNSENGSAFPLLAHGFSSAINQGLGSENLVAVVAQGNTIKLYDNHVILTGINDSTFPSGQIGLYVTPYADNGRASEAVFRDLRVWQL